MTHLVTHPFTGQRLRECQCGLNGDPFPPSPRVKPGRKDFCERCSGYINPAWTANAQTIDAFLDRLEDSLPGEDLTAFREHVVVRELAGRDRFQHRFLIRDNCIEGLEEAVDLALYALLDVLKHAREGRGTADIDLALTAAMHAFHGHSALAQLRQKRLGAP